MNSIDVLKSVKYAYYVAKFPSLPLEEIYSIVKNSNYRDNTANGLTKMVCDFVTYLGGFANRINVQGQYNKALGKHTKSTTKKGTPDLDIILFGKSIKIEIKVGKDKMSSSQVDIMQQIQAAGGLYFIAKDFDTTYAYLLSVLPEEQQELLRNTKPFNKSINEPNRGMGNYANRINRAY